MWTCPLCNCNFAKTNQVHSCMDKTPDDFLKGKSAHTHDLYFCFINEYKRLGDISVHATRSMITIAGNGRIAYIIQLGKNFIDVVFSFKQAYTDNLCFVKIKQLPGTGDYNHHFRMYFKEDINQEVKHYMKLALENSQL